MDQEQIHNRTAEPLVIARSLIDHYQLKMNTEALLLLKRLGLAVSNSRCQDYQ